EEEEEEEEDVHPGNFLFLPDGRLGLIDFGCVVRYDNESDWALLGRVNKAMLSGDEETIRSVMKEWQRLTDDPRDAEALELCCDFAKWCWKPYYGSGPFDFADSEYLQRGVDMVQSLVKKRVNRSHPTQLMQFRWQVGAWMLQYRLGACIDPKPILHEEVRAAGWNA
ncbi:MAG: AarF/UbiB family protein, partial [Planctomycetota bacterium]